ncbi:tRNA uridine-5-carboxymethylaminomethyl(34) synthesis GTPase MnmE [Phorcysia thermohydrogeniphila]|uniref:tRNA modification GTPase MnmE n=1 Tax=Phorcysia thermohydrogeniphila TaxID=936138 RepID=A0A4R1GGV9_9BACT|nr:tRNA uridine-5-carboxymethylaminomethyl(34) synthesis GTPase MnmE [Phorcysia thermohydrogeniphila]TCK06201.1 tRNA modification GTPase [Phorcysia thermohydrogeniphila]
MRDYLCEDTIAAIGTPIGRGAIGIVRISGKDSLRILQEMFRTKSGERKEHFDSRKMYYGVVVDSSGEPIDEVLTVYMRAPKTFTGEDIVEIHSHGGIVVVRKILREVLRRGARLAEPGEFTMRAFIHGKIDLVQAEAINELINATSEVSAKVALKHLEGELSKKIKLLRDKLLEAKAYIEAAVDFPEEEVEIIESGEVKRRIQEVLNGIEKLLSTYRDGRIIKEGIKVAIVGRPNVGKSSLLNAILQEERAIVTEVPGTTRDIIEETVTLEGVPIRLIDTAGIRESSDVVERIGIERSLRSIERADVILFVIDGSCGFTEEDLKVSEMLRGKENVILVLNKKDLGLKVKCGEVSDWRCVEISAKSGEGIKELATEIVNMVLLDPETVLKGDDVLITSERHRELLEKARDSLIKVVNSIEAGFESPEFLSMDIDAALNALGEIVGQVTTEDMLDIIFSRFCIGK